jgi:hypothetical protein
MQKIRRVARRPEKLPGRYTIPKNIGEKVNVKVLPRQIAAIDYMVP